MHLIDNRAITIVSKIISRHASLRELSFQSVHSEMLRLITVPVGVLSRDQLLGHFLAHQVAIMISWAINSRTSLIVIRDYTRARGHRRPLSIVRA